MLACPSGIGMSASIAGSSSRRAQRLVLVSFSSAQRCGLQTTETFESPDGSRHGRRRDRLSHITCSRSSETSPDRIPSPLAMGSSRPGIHVWESRRAKNSSPQIARTLRWDSMALRSPPIAADHITNSGSSTPVSRSWWKRPDRMAVSTCTQISKDATGIDSTMMDAR